MDRLRSNGSRIVAVALVCTVPVALIGSANGPVPARTGGFGEMTCHQCHSNNPLNDASGSLTLSGVPETYTSGEPYVITIAVTHPQLVRAGFQLSARFPNGENAGVFRAIDDLAETVPDDAGRITYIQHTAMGATVPAPGLGRWTLEWTAPAVLMPVVFHLAANAANGDGLSRGDFVYTASATSGPAAPAR